jgi:dTDP-4-dehydrorhamnose reductase
VRVFLTGASGFVGSNLREVFESHGAEVLAPRHAEVDITDRNRVLRYAADTRPDAVVHCAILNDLAGLRDRRRAWAAYVEATRNMLATGARVVLISTDWVFDGTQGPAPEDEPPNPINAYGFLKAACELVVVEAGGTVARIAGVQGFHRARPETVYEQDAGFGNLVAAVLSAGGRFTVWDGPGLNALATPTLATHAGEMIWRALELETTGILHCCGSEHVDRVTLARRAAEACGLDPELVVTGPPPPDAIPAGGAPYDTRLDNRATLAALDMAPAGLDSLFAEMACAST